MTTKLAYIKYYGEQCKLAAETALEARLFVRGWEQELDLIGLCNDPDVSDAIVLVYDEWKVVACGVRIKHFDRDIGIYVKEKYRRQGIGTEIYKLLSEGKELRACYGVRGSDKFWRKVGAKYED